MPIRCGGAPLGLNAQTAVRFYATSAADSSQSGMTVHISALLPLPAVRGEGGVRGHLRWAQNCDDLYHRRLICGAQNRGEAPSPSFAPLTRPLPARGGRWFPSALDLGKIRHSPRRGADFVEQF